MPPFWDLQDSFHNACVNDVTGAREQAEGMLNEFGCGARECPANYTCRVGAGAGGDC